MFEEERGLARRFSAMPRHGGRLAVQTITSVKLAYAVVAETGPFPDGEGSRLVTDQSQREIQALPVAGISVVGHSHGAAPGGLQFEVFRAEKNLTEINHKVSVPAKRFRVSIPAPFAGK
jgi:hypothetical protein